jgi:RecB family exonuclease
MQYLSYSQISLYQRCPMAYMFRYVEEFKAPPAGALVKGSAVHKGLEINYSQKTESYTDLPKTEVVEQAVTEFESRQDEVEWDKENESSAEAKDGVAAMTDIYQEEIAPRVQPVLVEQEFNIEVAGQQVKGFIDIVTLDGVRDTKTSAKTPPASVIENNFQLACYSLGHLDLMGVYPKELALDYTINLKQPKTVTLVTKPNLMIIEAFECTVAAVAKAVEQKIFYPNPGNFMCSEKGCGFWKLCLGGKRV